MKNQKSLKNQKKEIVNKTALFVGYSMKVLNKLPIYAMIEGIKAVKEISKTDDDNEIQNIFLTESIKNTNYQDFKNIATYFFNY